MYDVSVEMGANSAVSIEMELDLEDSMMMYEHPENKDDTQGNYATDEFAMFHCQECGYSSCE